MINKFQKQLTWGRENVNVISRWKNELSKQFIIQQATLFIEFI